MFLAHQRLVSENLASRAAKFHLDLKYLCVISANCKNKPWAFPLLLNVPPPLLVQTRGKCTWSQGMRCCWNGQGVFDCCCTEGCYGREAGAPQDCEAMSQLDNWSSAISHVGQCHRPALVENTPSFKVGFNFSCFLSSLSYNGSFTQYGNIVLEKNPHNIIALGEACYLTSLWTASISRATKALYWQAGTVSDHFSATCTAWMSFPSWTTSCTIRLTPT